MGKVDCLFLHVPKLINYYRPIGQFIWINFLPMGLLALADLLQRHDISTQVVHLGVEWIENHDFSVLDYIREKAPRIVAFDLHWHHQSFDVMEMAKKGEGVLSLSSMSFSEAIPPVFFMKRS